MLYTVTPHNGDAYENYGQFVAYIPGERRKVISIFTNHDEEFGGVKIFDVMGVVDPGETGAFASIVLH